MKITCQSCQSKYTVSDEKVQGKTVKIKCRKCGATIIVNSSGVTHGGDAAGAAPAGGDGSYMVNVAEGDQRTMSLDELVAAYNDGTVTADTYVWADGMADWQPLSGVDAVVAALNGAAQGAEEAAPAYEAAPEETPYVPAAAPSPSPMADPAPRAAARRDAGRRGPDLFGGGMAAQTAQDDVATSAPLFSAGPATGGLTGQREENSTLFSLSALTAKAGGGGGGGGFGATSTSSRTTATKEDSGLIDLRALAEAGAPPAPAASASMLGGDAGLFPLGVPQVSAPAPSLAPAAPAPDAKKSPVLLVVLGAAVMGIIVGVFLLVKGGGEKPTAPTAVATAAAAPAAPTATATAAASASASAAPSADASAEASAAPSASAAVAHGGGRRGGGARGGGARGGGKGAAAAPAGAPAKPAAPAKSSCGCAPGDLMCAMKCSAH